MSNATTIHRSFNRIQIFDYCIFYFSITGILCGSLDREIVKLNGIDKNHALRILILSMGTMTTVCLLISIIFWYLTEIRLLKYKGKISYTDDLFTTKNWKPLLCELFIGIWHPLPFLWESTFLEWDHSYMTHFEHYSNDILITIMIFFRVFYVFWFIMNNSYFMSSWAQRVCVLNGH